MEKTDVQTDVKTTAKKEITFDIDKIVEISGAKQDNVDILLEKQAGLTVEPDSGKENKQVKSEKKIKNVPSLEDFEKEIQPKDVKNESDTDKKEEKQYKLGGKLLTKSEMTDKLNEHFENKYDFTGVDDDSFKKYADLYTKAFDGQRKEDWQKSLGTRENELAKEKKEFQKERQLFEIERKKLKEIVSESDEDIEDDYDLTLTQKQRKIAEKLRAEEKLRETDELEKELAAKDNAIQFAELHYNLSNTYPELRTTMDIREVFRRYNTNQDVDKNDVKVAYTVYKILNDSFEYGFNDPNKFYELYKDTYKINLTGMPSKDYSQINEKAEKLKEKQEKAIGFPPNAQPVNPNPSSREDIIPGKTETEKLNAIYFNKK